MFSYRLNAGVFLTSLLTVVACSTSPSATNDAGIDAVSNPDSADGTSDALGQSDLANDSTPADSTPADSTTNFDSSEVKTEATDSTTSNDASDVSDVVDSACTPGSERCTCYGNKTCDGTLLCLSNLCVAAPDAYVPDTYVTDSFVQDTFVVDTYAPDAFVQDTFVVDTYAPDTYVADTYTCPTGDVGCACFANQTCNGALTCTANKCQDPVPTGNDVTFVSGRAKGGMTGYGWVIPGALDSISNPTCGGTLITAGSPCVGGTLWNSNSSLCVSGLIPKVDATANDAAGNWLDNWGIELGVSANHPEGAIGITHTGISATIGGVPNGANIRLTIHLTDGTSYCKEQIGSGVSYLLSSFNSKCYDVGGTNFTGDASKIDSVKLTVVSTTANAITVNNLCLTGITFQ